MIETAITIYGLFSIIGLININDDVGAFSFVGFGLVSLCLMFIFNYTHIDIKTIEMSSKICNTTNSELERIYLDGDFLCKNKAAFSKASIKE